jgi:biofilm PGA synthesis N-glycosyltransferase PgaC
VKVSVVVCTLNAIDVIEKKFGDIVQQNYPLSSIELIVVDGGSTDGTYEMLGQLRKGLSSMLDVTVVKLDRARGKANQINEGLRAAKGSIIVTTDADVRTDPGAIQLLVDSLSDEKVGAVCGRQVLTNSDENLATKTEATYRSYYEILRVGESHLHSTPIFHGGLSAFRREAIATIDEDVNADDTQLALGAIRKGFRAVYDPQSVFYTDSPANLRDSWRQRVRRGQGLQRVFWRNRDMILARDYGSFGFPIYPAELYMHTFAPILFGLAGLSMAAFILVSVPPPLTIPLVVLVLMLVYLKRDWPPIRFLLSLTFYELALVWAIVLHLTGHNYKRWSKYHP